MTLDIGEGRRTTLHLRKESFLVSSVTIQYIQAKVGTMVKCYESFQIMGVSVTLLQGQGHKVTHNSVKHSFVGISSKRLLGSQ